LRQQKIAVDTHSYGYAARHLSSEADQKQKPKPGKGRQPVRKLMGPNVFSNALKQQGPQAFRAMNDRLVMQALHDIL